MKEINYKILTYFLYGEVKKLKKVISFKDDICFINQYMFEQRLKNEFIKKYLINERNK